MTRRDYLMIARAINTAKQKNIPAHLMFYQIPMEIAASILHEDKTFDYHEGYALKAGQLTYDCRYSTMHGMPVTGGRGFRGLKPLWYNGVPP